VSPTVRAARDDDVAAVTALEGELFGRDAWSASSVAEELTGPRRRAVVAELDGRLAGYAVGLLADDLVDLQRIAVAPAYQRRGVARTLLTHLQAKARGDGAVRMLLEVDEANAAALALYTRAGFHPIDRRPRYYQGGGDALVLQSPLNQEEQ
jgi:ribosomal-protein-alanine acetyltransferase